ncbi:MAG: conjugal transfer protein TraG [Pseudopedobacter saltans]|uniref:Conjugal transfer protein TraG n=1 Tax=Pseudopedobacter saltans TaxID=151895 RepID=A0A2W5F4Z9_9SPHI|nr:MAG: conjugal transfer protein TraG [Pseudopedobacter saltans]
MTGENEQGLRAMLDFTRLISIAILIIHFYGMCHGAFAHWGWTAPVLDNIVHNFLKLPVFSSVMYAKLSSLLMLVVYLFGIRGKKDEKIGIKNALAYCITGLLLYFLSNILLYVHADILQISLYYMGMTALGYLLMVTGGTYLSRILKLKMRKDIFNKDNETFPQEERLLENEFSFNLPAQYQLNGEQRRSWINIINPFRAVLVAGTPGAGKTYFVVRNVIEQQIRKGFSMFLYDFKYDDLSKIAYNVLLKNHKRYKVPPSFYVINFDTPMYRCNPLEPESMRDITDATEAARTILLGLNKDWIKKQGEFFVESPINFLTSVIWFLRKYEGGRYCTLPHAIEMMQQDYGDLFPVLNAEPEIEVLVNPFISAYKNKAMEQLEGQTASAKIATAKLSSPNIYYVLSGNDFTLDINNPEAPKIVCMANNPEKSQTYGAVISLFVFRLLRVILQKGRNKSSIIVDELPSIFLNGIEQFIAVARSYKVSTVLCVQDFSQLVKDYGKELAEVIVNICGNLISGQVTGDTAKQLSERFGKIVQERESISINRNDTSVSKSTQLDSAIPASTIATLSSGEFVGIVADNPEERIRLKTFHSEIINNHDQIRKKERRYKEIPRVRTIAEKEIQANFIQIKNDVDQIIKSENERISREQNKSG